MKYYAHSINGEPKEKWQSLQEHLENTANLLVEFSQGFCDADYARNLGLFHDIGKYQKAFQDRLDGSNKKVEHSIYGALDWLELGLPESGMYCIAGHHSGLPDIGTKVDPPQNSTLNARIKRGNLEKADYTYYKNELSLQRLADLKESKKFMSLDEAKEYAFWTRMMFSCLTDADFLDTEKFYNNSISRGNPIDFKVALATLNNSINSFKPDSNINNTRNNLRMQVLSNLNVNSEIYFLNMPTGSGKTLTSMQFALNRAVASSKKKIIYVIPFTSIIEQNAKVFKDILGENAILEHHSNFDFINKINSTPTNTNTNTSIQDKLRLASENWDADIIVTTNVQFFQSLYGNRSRQVRKLHNIANSIILFDEVHMLPTNFLQPCLEGIKILTQKYNCEAVFMSATMPDFNNLFEEFEFKNIKTYDLIQNKSHFNKFKRCEIKNLTSISLGALTESIQEQASSLVVVNKKSTAKALYDNLSIKKYHLSTYMTHYDRDKTISSIRSSLEKGEQFCLVSTSLIEAGVDLDFDTAYRELAGLDNLLQTAGRCNREGKKEGCVTYSFSFEEEEYKIKSNDIQNKQIFTNEVFEKYEDVTSEDAINHYFKRLYFNLKGTIESMDFKQAIKSTSCNPNKHFGFDFKKYADKFKLIDDNSIGVVVMYDEACESFNNVCIDMLAKRKLQKYTVNLKSYEFQKLYDLGVIKEEQGLNTLSNMNYYTPETGILFDDKTNYIF